MNTSKKTIIYTIIIILTSVAVLLSASLALTLFLFNKPLLPTDIVKNDNRNQQTNQAVDENWTTWQNDVLGISFQYPKSWGKPITSPITDITNLELLTETNKNRSTDNLYRYGIFIYFTNLQIAPRLNIALYDNQYPGELYPNGRAFVYGPIDNFNQLKNSENICDYKINFTNNPSQTGTIRELESSCQNNVKTALLEDKKFFSNVPNRNDSGTYTGDFYQYKLSHYGFKKLENGYYDNLLATFFVGWTRQLKTPLYNIGDFLKSEITNRDEITPQEYQKNKENFVKFVNSIKTFKPVKKEAPPFQEINNEDPNITTIRKYYYNIASGNLGAAYDMYSNTGVSLTTYKTWYQNTIAATPRDFKLTAENTYQFFVDLQDENQRSRVYRTTMKVSEGKIISTDSEEITVSEVFFNDNTSAFVKSKNDINYVVLKQSGVEKIIDQAPDNFENENGELKSYIGGILKFYKLEFSPGGNYLMYSGAGWEWSILKIYGITQKEMLKEFSAGAQYGFNKNETEFYTCNSSGMIEAQVKTYSVPSFELNKNLFDLIKPKDALDADCKIDNDILSITFSCLVENGKINCDDKIKIKYNLDNGAVEYIN